jgi:hypothetical protein
MPEQENVSESDVSGLQFLGLTTVFLLLLQQLYLPWAFRATRSRSNKTIMLKTWDMSPARRNMFMLIFLWTVTATTAIYYYCYGTVS